MAGSRVLLVDDDPEICEFLAVLLELEGFDPVRATRAEEALVLATREQPAAMLVDLAMPDMDGLELCRRLRQAGVTAPVLVVSARPGEDLAVRAEQAGANAFIRKPFDNADLVERLRSFIGTNRAQP
ncbi:MAG TPA: response regulator transcription factor [Anaeromyxobacteraceae bacterium]|nr:response regulator transcription factor [Anaeromyxobacteraceae bacterium]